MKNKININNIDMNTEKIWTETDPAIPSDISGSYTGIPLNNYYDEEDEKPVQDADDL